MVGESLLTMKTIFDTIKNLPLWVKALLLFILIPLISGRIAWLVGGESAVESTGKVLGEALGVLMVVGLIFGGYFLPSLIAHKNEKKNTTAITVLNLFLGWTFIGWIVALIWAVMED